MRRLGQRRRRLGRDFGAVQARPEHAQLPHCEGTVYLVGCLSRAAELLFKCLCIYVCPYYVYPLPSPPSHLLPRPFFSLASAKVDETGRQVLCMSVSRCLRGLSLLPLLTHHFPFLSSLSESWVHLARRFLVSVGISLLSWPFPPLCLLLSISCCGGEAYNGECVYARTCLVSYFISAQVPVYSHLLGLYLSRHTADTTCAHTRLRGPPHLGVYTRTLVFSGFNPHTGAGRFAVAPPQMPHPLESPTFLSVNMHSTCSVLISQHRCRPFRSRSTAQTGL